MSLWTNCRIVSHDKTIFVYGSMRTRFVEAASVLQRWVLPPVQEDMT